MDNSVKKYRENFRKRHISEGYSGKLHFTFTVSVSVLIAIVCINQLNNVAGWEWITIPMTFLYANFAEYLGHKGPMHHKRPGLSLVYKRHTQQHHHFFTHENMAFDEIKDFKAVLFPPVLVLFFLFAFGTPVALLLSWLLGENVAYLFAITGVLYFLNYEVLHFAYHLPENHFISCLPVMAILRKHHTYHHDPALMSRYNFNITYPVADYLFGTLYKK